MPTATPSPHDETNDVATLQSMAISLPSNREAPSPPAPSACDKNMTSLPSNSTKRTYESPNIIVNWNNLKGLVESNMGPCTVCKGRNRRLVKKSTTCYAVTVGIHCEDCENKKKELYQNINYESKIIKKIGN